MKTEFPDEHFAAPAPLALPRGNLLLVGTGAISVSFTPGWTNLLRSWYPEVAIRSVLTHSAESLVSTKAIAALSGHPVVTEGSGRGTAFVSHRVLANWADAVLVMPATASFLSKLSHAITDSMALLICAIADCPVVLVPSVPQRIWRSKAMQRNKALLEDDGYLICGPQLAVTASQREPEMGGPPDISHVLQFLSAVVLAEATREGTRR